MLRKYKFFSIVTLKNVFYYLKLQFYVQDFLFQFNIFHGKQTQIKNVIIQTLDELKRIKLYKYKVTKIIKLYKHSLIY